MAAASLKTELTPSSHVFPDRDTCVFVLCCMFLYNVSVLTSLYVFADYILSSTASATLFFLSHLLIVNNMKTLVCDYHLNDPTTFLHHQIQVCSAYARILDLGYKIAFFVLHVHGLVVFQYRAQIQNL